MTLDRDRVHNPTHGESKEDNEVNQTAGHRDAEEKDFPVQDLGERGATTLKQGEKLLLVVRRRDKIVGADRTLDIKRESRRDHVARIDRQDQENDREQRKQQ